MSTQGQRSMSLHVSTGIYICTAKVLPLQPDAQETKSTGQKPGHIRILILTQRLILLQRVTDLSQTVPTVTFRTCESVVHADVRAPEMLLSSNAY